MKVLIVAGHGQGDSGACACGYKEADLTREVASLLSQYGGVTVYDMSKDLYKQQAAGKRFDFTPFDYVLEIHFNARWWNRHRDSFAVRKRQKSPLQHKVFLMV